MSAAPAHHEPGRHRRRCGAKLVRHRYPSGKWEAWTDFHRRLTCGSLAACAPKTKPEVEGEVVTMLLPIGAPNWSQTFHAVYQAALAQGIDLLELNDATWEP